MVYLSTRNFPFSPPKLNISKNFNFKLRKFLIFQVLLKVDVSVDRESNAFVIIEWTFWSAPQDLDEVLFLKNQGRFSILDEDQNCDFVKIPNKSCLNFKQSAKFVCFSFANENESMGWIFNNSDEFYQLAKVG